MRPAGRTDDQVVEAMRQAIKEAEKASSKTTGFIIWRAREILAGAGYDGAVPSDRTLYRLFGTLAHGRHVTGSASTRRSLAGRPVGTFGSLAAAAPGEVVQVDSTPLDVLVLLDDGVPGRVEMTGLIDVATRVVPAAVLRPTTKAVDASVLLARALTPEPFRPGWPEALKMARSVLPYERLLAIDDRLEQAAARPVIVPDTLVIDHGAVFVSAAFRSACRHLGISIQPAHLGSGAEKGHIERHFGTVASLFSQFATGYLGRSADRRGRHVEDQPLWSMAELQELLDEWLLLWLSRPHDGLRDPEHPGRAFTPNEKYASLVEAAGYLPVALGPGDYVELLPAEWRAVNAYGVKLNWRTYDSDELGPLRLQPSGVKERNGLWEVRHDPYDVSRVHLRGPDGWITAFWKHLSRAPVPFGELAWDHARRGLGAGAAEEEIADAVTALLRRASAGPEVRAGTALSKRDRRVAARTRAAAPLSGAREQPPAAGEREEGASLAEVIPMPIFDPFAEADKPW
jgi:transposase InsO family protein